MEAMLKFPKGGLSVWSSSEEPFASSLTGRKEGIGSAERGPVRAFARAGKALGSFAQIFRSIGGPSSEVKSEPGQSYSMKSDIGWTRVMRRRCGDVCGQQAGSYHLASRGCLVPQLFEAQTRGNQGECILTRLRRFSIFSSLFSRDSTYPFGGPLFFAISTYVHSYE